MSSLVMTPPAAAGVLDRCGPMPSCNTLPCGGQDSKAAPARAVRRSGEFCWHPYGDQV